MNTFAKQIDRALAVKYGVEAVSIAEQGHYTAVSGEVVNISKEVGYAVQSTVSYLADDPIELSAKGSHATQIEITNETSLSAAQRHIKHGHNAVVLNFASATSPGGGFLSGARAQEEYLARSSALYECIRNNPMYQIQRDNYNPLYTDYMIYSPEIPVYRADDGGLMESPYTVAMITAAAVHASRVPVDDQSRILPIMWDRILKVLSVGLEQGHDSIVLGAWGCGAFGNDGYEIAQLFKKAISENFAGAYRCITFAIVDWSDEKRFISPFDKVFQLDNAQPDGAESDDAQPESIDLYDLKRFISAQEQDYQKALSELKRGQKETHWIWYIFPQIDGLGFSSIAQHYSIKSLEEAQAYLQHPILGPQLVECAETLLGVDGKTAGEIMGEPDDLKLRSSMTLFELAEESIRFFIATIQLSTC